MPKIKKASGKIQPPCTHCFEPAYLKVNFSYASHIGSQLSNNYKEQIYDRLLFLSKDTFLTLSGMDKKLSFEYVPQKDLGMRREIPAPFIERFPALSKGKIAIIRLYPNDNPILGRLIGMVIKNIFYVFYVDIGGVAYKH